MSMLLERRRARTETAEADEPAAERAIALFQKACIVGPEAPQPAALIRRRQGEAGLE